MRFLRPAVFLAVLAAAGCGGSGPGVAPGTVECKGTVTLPGGTAYPEGIVYFESTPGERTRDELTRVTNGAFAFPGGIIAGKYKIVFDKELPPGKTSPVPSKYRNGKTSDYFVDITKAEPDLKIELK